ncbi:dipeptidase [Oceanobacillus polygoni]|uniref:Membrane dipeptidase n=1 Tax=Oceanobacillus polygoni TaxID=1235259 RepID=A0A9X0YWN3_9BACI|nr:dipeptidase [Oceanobacillus polygoni]MBP2080162.1 membrane dipeptidase [Oceanobacillus polygoni]
MKIVDTHCDALLKLQHAKREQHGNQIPLDFRNAPQIQTNLARLTEGNVMLQFFAIFIPPHVPSDEKWQHALEQIDLFHTEIIDRNPEMKHIKKWSEIASLKSGEIGAVLTLEGADAFGNDLMKLRHLYRFGVLSIGITWNNANLCADGAEEPRGAGLTLLGKEVVQLNNNHGVFTDVAHATVKGFWDIMELADFPIASHSNARAICDHPRNLDDEQLKAMITNNGLIHVVFYPPFINEGKEEAQMNELLKHIDHICALGGVKHIGFGSDFDGISNFVTGLEDASCYPTFIEKLLHYYSEEEVRGFAYQNFINHRLIRGSC